MVAPAPGPCDGGYGWHVIHLTHHFNIWAVVLATQWPYIVTSHMLTCIEGVLNGDKDVHLRCGQLLSSEVSGCRCVLLMVMIDLHWVISQIEVTPQLD
jgi:hypothetical protein